MLPPRRWDPERGTKKHDGLVRCCGVAGRGEAAPTWATYPLGPDDMVSLEALGCANKPWGEDVAHILQAPDPGWFSFAGTFITAFLLTLAAVFAVSLASYGLIRAIGWVIGGFATS